jgi:hypothetical protein
MLGQVEHQLDEDLAQAILRDEVSEIRLSTLLILNRADFWDWMSQISVHCMNKVIGGKIGAGSRLLRTRVPPENHIRPSMM